MALRRANRIDNLTFDDAARDRPGRARPRRHRRCRLAARLSDSETLSALQAAGARAAIVERRACRHRPLRHLHADGPDEPAHRQRGAGRARRRRCRESRAGSGRSHAGVSAPGTSRADADDRPRAADGGADRAARAAPMGRHAGMGNHPACGRRRPLGRRASLSRRCAPKPSRTSPASRSPIPQPPSRPSSPRLPRRRRRRAEGPGHGVLTARRPVHRGAVRRGHPARRVVRLARPDRRWQRAARSIGPQALRSRGRRPPDRGP